LTDPSGVSKHFRYPPIINDTGLNISIHCFNPIYKNSKSEIPLALNEIEIFGSFSGLIMNKDKTEGLWISAMISTDSTNRRADKGNP
jgi:hypothetical protein